MADKNKIYYGLSQLYVVPINRINNHEPPVYGEPIAIPGAVSFSQTAESEESVFYADNRKYWGAYVDNGYSGEIEISKLPNQAYMELFGWYEDARGGLVEVQNGKAKNFALLGQFEGDAHAGRWVLYNCAASKPSSETTTAGEEGVTPTTLTINYTASSIFLNKATLITKYTMFNDEDPDIHEVYDTWFDGVMLPLDNMESDKE